MIDLPATAADTDEGKLSDADVEKLWKAFGAFDADASGAISLEELGEVMRSLGQTPPYGAARPDQRCGHRPVRQHRLRGVQGPDDIQARRPEEPPQAGIRRVR